MMLELSIFRKAVSYTHLDVYKRQLFVVLVVVVLVAFVLVVVFVLVQVGFQILQLLAQIVDLVVRCV